MRPAGRSFVALPRVVAGIAALVMAPCAHTQLVERQLDAGLVHASLTGLASTTLLFASGSAREVRERWGWSASASVAQGGTGGPSGFGTAGIELAPLATWGWRTTIDATLGGAVGFDGTMDYDEERSIIIGMAGSELLVVVYTMRDERIRIISARRPQRHEQERYYRQGGEA